MQTETPGVDEGAEAIGVVEQITAETDPLITGPVPVVWFGVGAFLFIFVLMLVMLIRGRVIVPARRKTMEGPVFEPAGANAEITFDDLGDQDLSEEADEEAPSAEDDRTTLRADEEEAELALGPELEATTDAVEHASEAKGKRSPFAGLFSRKENDDRHTDEAPRDDMGGLAEDTDTHEAADFEAEVEISESEEATPPKVDAIFGSEDSQLDDHEVEHETAHQIEHERPIEPERPVRSFEEIQAAEEAAYERRQSEADIEKGLQSFGASDHAAQRDAAPMDAAGIEHQIRLLGASLERRINSLTDQVDARLENAAVAMHDGDHSGERISEAHFAEFAELLSEQFASLREATHTSLEGLSSRIAKLETAPAGAAALSTQVADLNRILGGALSPASEARASLSGVLNRALPAGSFALSHKLSNGKVAAALVSVPGSPTPFVVDDQFPLDAFATYKRQRLAGGSTAENNFRGVMRRHIADAIEDFVIRGETGDHAFLLAPTEQIFTALHTDFSDLMKESHDAGVWIMSPTTMAATLQALFSATTAGPAPGHAVGGELLDEIIALRKRVSTLETEKRSASDAADFGEEAASNGNGAHQADATGDLGSLSTETSGSEDFADVSINKPETHSKTAVEEAFERIENEERYSELRDEQSSETDRPPFPLR